MNDLHRCLTIIKALSTGPLSTEELSAKFNISRPTLRRDIAYGRHLGAKIISFRSGVSSLYRLENWPECCRTVETWIVLEEKRDLTQLGRTIM